MGRGWNLVVIVVIVVVVGGLASAVGGDGGPQVPTIPPPERDPFWSPLPGGGLFVSPVWFDLEGESGRR